MCLMLVRVEYEACYNGRGDPSPLGPLPHPGPARRAVEGRLKPLFNPGAGVDRLAPNAYYAGGQ